jgi:GT2 family glycosyltransferase
MDVSVVIINYNTFQLTCDCIASVIEKTREISYEIIVVDNASTEVDADAFVMKYPDIKLVKNAQNVGFASGNNAGIAVASGDFILLLNSDTILINNAVGIALKFLRDHPECAVVGARLEFPDKTIQHSCQRFPSVRYKLFEGLRLQKIMSRQTGGKILLGSFFDHNTAAFPDWIWGTFFLFQKNVLNLLSEKKLADDFFMYGEDMQWCLQFRKLKRKIGFCPEARIIHLMGKSNGAKNELMTSHFNRFMMMNYSPFHQWIIRWIDNLLLSS